jgi:hypothetical protein
LLSELFEIEGAYDEVTKISNGIDVKRVGSPNTSQYFK